MVGCMSFGTGRVPAHATMSRYCAVEHEGSSVLRGARDASLHACRRRRRRTRQAALRLTDWQLLRARDLDARVAAAEA